MSWPLSESTRENCHINIRAHSTNPLPTHTMAKPIRTQHIHIGVHGLLSNWPSIVCQQPIREERVCKRDKNGQHKKIYIPQHSTHSTHSIIKKSTYQVLDSTGEHPLQLSPSNNEKTPLSECPGITSQWPRPVHVHKRHSLEWTGEKNRGKQETMATEDTPQQHPVREGSPAEIVRQGEVDGN